ncbi:MAG: hypothetical protein ABIQ57_17670 [Candidatus Kapaibacterium sp.]
MDQRIDNADIEDNQNLKIVSLPGMPESALAPNLMFTVICDDLPEIDFPFSIHLEFLTQTSYTVSLSAVQTYQEVSITPDLVRMTTVAKNGIVTSIPFPWPVAEANATFKSGPVYIGLEDSDTPPGGMIGKYIRVVVSTVHNA